MIHESMEALAEWEQRQARLRRQYAQMAAEKAARTVDPVQDAAWTESVRAESERKRLLMEADEE